MTSSGADLHQHQLNSGALDRQGELLQRREIPTQCHQRIHQWFGSCSPAYQIVVDSASFSGRPVVLGTHLDTAAGVAAPL